MGRGDKRFEKLEKEMEESCKKWSEKEADLVNKCDEAVSKAMIPAGEVCDLLSAFAAMIVSDDNVSDKSANEQRELLGDITAAVMQIAQDKNPELFRFLDDINPEDFND